MDSVQVPGPALPLVAAVRLLSRLIPWNPELRPKLMDAVLYLNHPRQADQEPSVGRKTTAITCLGPQRRLPAAGVHGDQPATYDSRPRRSLTQWLESRRLYDWLVAAYQNSSWSAREIEPFIAKHRIDMSEFKPQIFRSLPTFSAVNFGLNSPSFRLLRSRWERSPRRATLPGGAYTGSRSSR